MISPATSPPLRVVLALVCAGFAAGACTRGPAGAADASGGAGGGGGGGSAGTGAGAAAESGGSAATGSSCKELYDCLVPCKTQSCKDDCRAKASDEAKEAFNALSQCVKENCCGSGLACGGTATMCDASKLSGAACCQCNSDMQCAGGSKNAAPDPKRAKCADKLGACNGTSVTDLRCEPISCGGGP